jgi:RNA polymerase sigma-70 factor, ECF subfamily
VRLPQDAMLETLEVLCASDLLLAYGCIRGDRLAIGKLEKDVLGPAITSAARVDASESFLDEVLQELRERLLIGEEGGPRLAKYNGVGSLMAWTRAVAFRLALNLKRELGSAQPLPFRASFRDSRTVDASPELLILKGKYSAEFN